MPLTGWQGQSPQTLLTGHAFQSFYQLCSPLPKKDFSILLKIWGPQLRIVLKVRLHWHCVQGEILSAPQSLTFLLKPLILIIALFWHRLQWALPLNNPFTYLVSDLWLITLKRRITLLLLKEMERAINIPKNVHKTEAAKLEPVPFPMTEEWEWHKKPPWLVLLKLYFCRWPTLQEEVLEQRWDWGSICGRRPGLHAWVCRGM